MEILEKVLRVLFGIAIVGILLSFLFNAMANAFVDENCGRLEKQLKEHIEDGLYPGFYLTEKERETCGL